jgi:hypothetical protein
LIILLPSSFVWSDQLHVTGSKRGRQFIEGYHRWISPTLLQAADVLLAEARNLSKLFYNAAGRFHLSFRNSFPILPRKEGTAPSPTEEE